MRNYINLVEGQQLVETSKKQKAKIDSMIDTIGAGSTYADVEKIYNQLPGGFFKGDRNYFLGSLAKKLGVKGMYKPDSSKMGGIVLTKPSENSTRYAESGTAFGLGMKQADVKALAQLNMLPPKRLEKAKEKYPDWDVWKSDSKAGVDGPVDAPAGTDTKGRQDGPDALKPDAKKGVPNDGKLRLSGGETFYRTPDGKGLRLLQKHAGGLVRRMDELVRKMNESVPNSLKAVLSESDRAQLMFEALTEDEAKELIQVVQDLEKIANFKDEQGFLISDQNRSLLADRIKQYQPVIQQAQKQAGSGSANTIEPDTNTDDAADDASKKSDDKGADPKAQEKPIAGNLKKFAKSGKGGLANDKDEVEAIKELQQYLTDMGFDPNGVDGKYGNGTVNAVKEFQKYFGAKVDGDAGPETIGQIVKLRSFSFKGGKTFIDFRKDMSRMEELIKKGGAIKKSTENSSRDFRSLISIVEQSLTEALSDQEKKELTDLIAQYDDVMSDAEFAAAMPKVSYDRYKKIIDDAKKLDQDDGSTDAVGSEEDPDAPADQEGGVAQGMDQADADAAAAANDKAQNDRIDGIAAQSDAEAKAKADAEAKAKADADGDQLAKDADVASYVNDGAEGYYRIPDSMRQELGLDTGKPKYVSLKLSKNGKIIYISHRPNGGSGPTVRVDSTEGKMIADFLKDQGAEFIDPSAEEEPKSVAPGTGKDGPAGGAEAPKVASYTGELRNDTVAFYKTSMDRANAEAFVAAQSLEGKDAVALTELQGQISRIMSVLNGNQRVPDSVGEPNGGQIVNKPDAVAVLRTFKDKTILDAMRKKPTSTDAKPASTDADAVDAGADAALSSGAQERLNGYMNTPNAKTDKGAAIEMAKKIVADKEAFALLDEKTQRAMVQISKMTK